MDDYSFKRSIADSFACIARAADRAVTHHIDTHPANVAKILSLVQRIREPRPSGHPQLDCDIFASWDKRRVEAALELTNLIQLEEKE